MASGRVIVQAFNRALNKMGTLRTSYGALKTLSLVHERIHAGKLYRHSEVHSIANGGTFNHLIVPTSGSANLHLQSMNIKADAGIVAIKLHENPFTNADSLGSDDTSQWVNQNRKSINTVPMVAHESPFIDANSLGTTIFTDLITDVSKDAGGEGEGIENEIELDNTKTYLLRVENYTGANVATVVKFSVYDASSY